MYLMRCTLICCIPCQCMCARSCTLILHIRQFYIANSSYASFIRQVSLLPIPSDPSLTPVTTLATSNTEEYVYALTPGKVSLPNKRDWPGF